VRDIQASGERPLFWIRSSLKDLEKFPAEVREHVGYALSAAQFGGKHQDAKPWKGDGAGVFEVVEDFRSDTFRAVYTVRFEEAVYVLHAFQKKSTKGIATSQADRELIAKRLKDAIADHEERYGKAKK
jgi:phage-related protein